MTRPGTPITKLFGRALAQAITTIESDDGNARILDAAFQVLVRRGTKAATMDDVAAAAGISRATLFRRFASKDELFERVVAREMGRFLTDLAHRFRTVTDPTDQVAEGFQACLTLRDYPLFRDAVAEGPQSLVGMLVHGDPSPAALAHHAVRSNLAHAQSIGTLPPGDPDVQADLLIHLMIGYLAAPSLAVDLDNRAAAESFARLVVAPILTGGASAAS